MSALLMTPAVWRTPEQRRSVTLADVLNPLAPYKEEDWLPAGLRADFLKPKAHVIAAARKALQAPRQSTDKTSMGLVGVSVIEKPLECQPVVSKMTTSKQRRPRKAAASTVVGDKAVKPKKNQMAIKDVTTT